HLPYTTLFRSKGEMAVSRWTRGRLPRFPKTTSSNGPSLLFILVALIAVAVAGARLLGFGPGQGAQTAQTRITPPSPQGTAPLPQAPPAPPAPQTPPASTPTPPPQSAARPVALVYHAHGTATYAPGATHAAQRRPAE